MIIGVLGSGLMGKGILHFLATVPSVNKIYWKSSANRNLKIALSEILEKQKVFNQKNPQKSVDIDSIVGKVQLVDSSDFFSECDFIHEAVSESYTIKKSILHQLSVATGPKTILASTTSSLSVTELGFATPTPERVIGLHFFNPATKMKLVEIISGLSTSQETLNSSVSYIESLGKFPVRVADSPGFIVNRMLIPLINEAVCILADNVATRESIDNAMKWGANHPLGPLQLADFIGNDIVLSIMQTLYEETGDQKYRPHPFLKRMVRGGLLGQKSGRGFYEYLGEK